MPAGDFFKPIYASAKAAVYLLCHVAIAALILIGIWLLEQLISLLWKSNNPLLFDLLPLKWFFHALDVGVLLVFGFYGIVSVAKSFRE